MGGGQFYSDDIGQKGVSFKPALTLVKDVLGVGVGDDVITESRGQVVRLRLEGTTVHVSEKAVNFQLWGMRYRKNGIPGKRQEYLILSAENDLE